MITESIVKALEMVEKKRVTELCVYYDVNYRNKANGEDKHICKTYTAIYVEEFDF